VVQHPQKAAKFGYENLSRLSLTPPMIVQLTVRDMNGNSIVPYPRRAAFLICICHCKERRKPILYGNLASSVDHLEDTNGNMGLQSHLNSL
ncbi:hypothetical protein B0H14DRAFT_2417179, partial [Mycena olivaceomarginata]